MMGMYPKFLIQVALFLNISFKSFDDCRFNLFHTHFLLLSPQNLCLFCNKKNYNNGHVFTYHFIIFLCLSTHTLLKYR